MNPQTFIKTSHPISTSPQQRTHQSNHHGALGAAGTDISGWVTSCWAEDWFILSHSYKVFSETTGRHCLLLLIIQFLKIFLFPPL